MSADSAPFDQPGKAHRIALFTSIALVLLSAMWLLGIAITGIIVNENGGSILPAANAQIIAACVVKTVSWIVLIVCASKKPIF